MSKDEELMLDRYDKELAQATRRAKIMNWFRENGPLILISMSAGVTGSQLVPLTEAFNIHREDGNK